MESIYLLIPVSVVLVFGIAVAFWWSVRSGQFDDLEVVGCDKAADRQADDCDVFQGHPQGGQLRLQAQRGHSGKGHGDRATVPLFGRMVW